MAREPQCGNCLFFELHDDAAEGEPIAGDCKRLPPICEPDDRAGRWPIVAEDETPCGEHRFRPIERQFGPKPEGD